MSGFRDIQIGGDTKCARCGRIIYGGEIHECLTPKEQHAKIIEGAKELRAQWIKEGKIKEDSPNAKP